MVGFSYDSYELSVSKTGNVLYDCVITNMSCGYDAPGMILLQPNLYTYGLLTGVAFEVLPLSSYALIPTMLLLLETFLELLLWNSFQCHCHIPLDVFSILKYSSL